MRKSYGLFIDIALIKLTERLLLKLLDFEILPVFLRSIVKVLFFFLTGEKYY